VTVKATMPAPAASERIAREALERISERGRVVYSFTEAGPAQRLYRCPLCKGLQAFEGLCCARECLASIARAALDDIRRIA
jgi:hypothetical protein